MSIQYTDGIEVESRIFQILDQQENPSSKSSICPEHYKEWAVRYHLCAERSNLLRHLDFSGLDVLEIGAGMGAVSRFLAEESRSLTVLEGTEKRFKSLSARLKDLRNWTGKVESFQTAEFDRKFDAICVIGVLEYSELYMKAPVGTHETPFSWFLKKATSYLKDEGVLILAIENKLGIKYWNGAAEDHSGKIFDGICDYPSSPSAKTFSRKEIKTLLAQSGLSQIDEHYPFPDYKIPSTIISSDFIESHPDLACDLTYSKNFENYGNPRLLHYPDALALRSVTKAGLLEDFSNSFLYLASKTPDSSVRKHVLKSQLINRELAWHYSNSRKVPVVTVFRETDRAEEPIEILKKRLFGSELGDFTVDPVAVGKNLKIKWKQIPPTSPALGEKLELLLLKQVYFEKWSEFLRELKLFVMWSFKTWEFVEEDGVGLLRGDALDAVFLNAAKISEFSGINEISGNENNSEHTYSLFDLEWISEQPIRKSWFVFRNVFALGRMAHLFQLSRPFNTLLELYENLCTSLEVQPDFENDILCEAEFQSLASNSGDVETHRTNLLSLFEHILATPDFPRSPHESFQANLRHKELQRDFAAFKKELTEKVADLEKRNIDLLTSQGVLQHRNQEIETQLILNHHLLDSMPHRFAEKLNRFLLRFPIFHRILKLCLGK